MKKRNKADVETFEKWAKRTNYISSENQKITDKYQDAIDDAGEGASQQKINERMGL